MILYAKPGTHSARYMRVKYKRKLPQLNDCFQARDASAGRHERWSRFCVCEIKVVGGQMLYFLERM